MADAVGALRQGAHDYVTKPFDVEELVIRGLLGRGTHFAIGHPSAGRAR